MSDHDNSNVIRFPWPSRAPAPRQRLTDDLMALRQDLIQLSARAIVLLHEAARLLDLQT